MSMVGMVRSSSGARGLRGASSGRALMGILME